MLTRILPIALLVALALPVAASGAPQATTSVVGGRTAAIDDWPSIAFLAAGWDADGDGEIDSSSACTGTVIKPEWIVTAAHCAYRDDGKPIDAMVAITGSADVDNPVGEVIPADKLVEHPTWNPQTLMGDVLLVHLAEPSTRPAMPLARPGTNYGLVPSVPNAAGWGLTDEAAQQETSVLQEAFLEIIDDAVCKNEYDPTFDPNTQTCAFSKGAAGVCRGDSGGPLTVLDQGGVPHLWGITSYGTQLGHNLPPCSLQAPAVFSWAPAFAKWIDVQTGEVLPPPPPKPTPPPPSQPLPTTPRDTTAPALRGAKLSARKLRAARKGATIARKTGAKLRFTLSEAAAVRVTVLKGRKTLSPSATIAGQAGRTTKRFSGRLGGKKLKPGRYRLQLGAVDLAGNSAEPVRIPFRIVR